MGSEAFGWPSVRYCPRICLKWLGKTSKNLS